MIFFFTVFLSSQQNVMITLNLIKNKKISFNISLLQQQNKNKIVLFSIFIFS